MHLSRLNTSRCIFVYYMNASFFGYVPFNTEDGGVTLNGAKVIKTLEFADAIKVGIIHEVDGFISPSILWRYADQCESFAYRMYSKLSVHSCIISNTNTLS